MKVVCCGTRTIKNKVMIFEKLDEFHSNTPITEIVSGCSQGPDIIGELWASKNNIPIKNFPPKWITQGKAAGPIRNKEMAIYADYAIIFWDGESKGSLNMIEQMETVNKPYKLYRI